MKYLIIILSILFGSQTFGQINSTCSETIPWDEDCVSIDPPTIGPTSLYYSFSVPATSIFFSYIYLTSCQGITTEYVLYDMFCNPIDTSETGSFIIIPDQEYIIGFTIVCESGNIITICPSELIALPIELISFNIQYNVLNDFTYFSWSTGSETNNRRFILNISSDCLEWSEIDVIQSLGNGGSYQSKKRLGVEGIRYFRLDSEDSNGIISHGDINALDYPERIKLKAYNLLGQEL